MPTLTVFHSAVFASFLAFSLPVSAELRAGSAKVVITPPAGVNMAGYYNYRACEGVLDDIHARALVMDDGSTKAALVTLDLIGTPGELVMAVRSAIDQSGVMKGANVMISATHAHTGPVPGRFLRTPDGPQDGIASPDSVHAKYLAGLPALIAGSVVEASRKLKPASVTGISGECRDVAFCRRFYMRDGTVGWNPGKLNANAMTPTGPTDPQIQAILFRDAGQYGASIPVTTIYANFSMHPDTVGGARISADYPGALSAFLAAYHGPDCLTLYGNGTCGNLNRLDIAWERQQGGPGEANRLAALLAASIFRAEKSERPIHGEKLQVRSIIVPLDIPDVSAEQLEMARATVRKKEAGPQPTFMELVHANRLLDLAPRQGQPIEAEVQVVCLGKEIAWIGFPGEVFVELGLALKKRSPFRHTMISTLTNGNWGYIPDRRSYAERAYEAESARVEPGSGEKLVEAAAQILKEIYAGE